MKKKKKAFIEFVKNLLLFLFFSQESCGILALLLGIKSSPPALESKVLTTGPLGKSPEDGFNTAN